jgi:hypothetical protein
MPGQKSGCFARLFSCLACLVVIALIVGLSLYFFGGNDSGIPELPEDLKNLPKDLWGHLPNITIFNAEDPWDPSQANPENASKWKTNGNSGLEFKLVNALDTQWYDYFDLAVKEWDDGNPDALTFTTETAAQADSECSGITGVMKMCNGDYGETDWKGAFFRSFVSVLLLFVCDPNSAANQLNCLLFHLPTIQCNQSGINKVLLQNGWITSSMARMNDHFFTEGGDADKRQVFVLWMIDGERASHRSSHILQSLTVRYIFL